MTACLLLAFGASLHGQDLRSVLLSQLRSTHNKAEWFVPVNVAVADLTPEQAAWSGSKANHSVGQLANHLLFWNQRELEKLSGVKSAAFNGNNNETFDSFDQKSWAATVRGLDTVMTDLEKLVQGADENKLKSMAGEISHVATHNAYHTGQIVFVRKEQGSWDAEKGVK